MTGELEAAPELPLLADLDRCLATADPAQSGALDA